MSDGFCLSCPIFGGVVAHLISFLVLQISINATSMVALVEMFDTSTLVGLSQVMPPFFLAQKYNGISDTKSILMAIFFSKSLIMYFWCFHYFHIRLYFCFIDFNKQLPCQREFLNCDYFTLPSYIFFIMLCHYSYLYFSAI